MGLAMIEGRSCYVVQLDEIPDLPIGGTNILEAAYAMALTDAIEKGKITEPGIYAIVLTKSTRRYLTYEIGELIEE